MAFVIVNGMPGAGKTTLARALSGATGAPMASLDEVKEAMADAFGRFPDDEDQAMDWSDDLGYAAVLGIGSLLADAHGDLILELPVGPAEAPALARLLAAAGVDLAGVHEIWCDLPLAESKRRFAERAPSRHPIHIERRRAEEHRDVFDQSWIDVVARMEPMAAGPVHKVDTREPIDVPALAAAAGLADRRVRQPLVVLVNGLPGAGKTTLARELGTALGVPLFSVDPLKEGIADALGPMPEDWAEHEAWSGRVGVAAQAAMWRLTADSPRGAVLEAPFSETGAGRLRTHLRKVGVDPGQVVEVFCEVPGQVSWDRFMARAPTRHHIHIERRAADESPKPLDWPMSEHWKKLIAEAAPLGLGAARRVDTTRPVDVPGLVEWIRSVSGGA